MCVSSSLRTSSNSLPQINQYPHSHILLEMEEKKKKKLYHRPINLKFKRNIIDSPKYRKEISFLFKYTFLFQEREEIYFTLFIFPKYCLFSFLQLYVHSLNIHILNCLFCFNLSYDIGLYCIQLDASCNKRERKMKIGKLKGMLQIYL